MNLSLPFIIIMIIIPILAVYGSFYAYATTNIQPQDLKTFEEDLKNIDSNKISQNEINTISNLANKIESGVAIKDLPSSQISTNVAIMRSNLTEKTDFESLNQKTKSNQAIATRYDFLFKGDIAKQIRIAYNIKLIELRQKMIQTQEKAADDFEAGNNQAVAADLKQYVEIAKEYNSLIDTAANSLLIIVTKLDSNPKKYEDYRISLQKQNITVNGL
jgi:hypothetical protein